MPIGLQKIPARMAELLMCVGAWSKDSGNSLSYGMEKD